MQTGLRSDGRAVTDVRPIQSMCSLLPRTHGSALFTRGETQVLGICSSLVTLHRHFTFSTLALLNVLVWNLFVCH